jgi:hypothetical protein
MLDLPHAANGYRICSAPLGHYPPQFHTHSVCHALAHLLESHPPLTKFLKLNLMLGKEKESRLIK